MVTENTDVREEGALCACVLEEMQLEKSSLRESHGFGGKCQLWKGSAMGT